jgi:hypothetical protein
MGTRLPGACCNFDHRVETSTIMVVTKSSNESMRMRLLGFAKAIANLDGKRRKYEDSVRCDTRLQQADKNEYVEE